MSSWNNWATYIIKDLDNMKVEVDTNFKSKQLNKEKNKETKETKETKELKSELEIVKQENIKIKSELEFYKSIFKTHGNSAIYNLKIKKIKGKDIWIDRVREWEKFPLLDKDEEVIEWLKPIRCER